MHKRVVLILGLVVLALRLTLCAAQDANLEVSLDANSETVPLPKIFKPNIDISGRGFHRDATWPQTIAAKEVLEAWQNGIGFTGFYRLQYNLWEIYQLAKAHEAQNKLLQNYEEVIKRINGMGGVVIVDIFGTPAGLGKALDKKSAPQDMRAFKALVKNLMRDLSVTKKYNVWYELWNAPDLEDFFLGRKQEYFMLYRAVAEAKKELEIETKMHIPLGGPSVSGWFQNIESNTLATPERSLIYELIKFCYRYHLPLDFISWHGYSTDPLAEKETTIYKKSPVTLIRDWLSYFNFDRATPLLVDEWNYDRGSNLLQEREEKSYIAASYIPSRIEHMYEAGIDNQVYFSLEDFRNNKEGVVRNVGAFSFETGDGGYKGTHKEIFNVFRMLANAGNRMFAVKLQDDFVGAIATKTDDGIALIIYNYTDPDSAMNYLSRNLSSLSSSERKMLLRIITSDVWQKVLDGTQDLTRLHATKKIQSFLRDARQLDANAKKYISGERKVALRIKNLQGNYLYQRNSIDSSCSLNCAFTPSEQKEIVADGQLQEELSLKPYSVTMIVLKQKPPEPAPQAVTPAAPSQEAPNAQ